MTDTAPGAPAIAPAELDWLDGQPVSRRFGDVYFSRAHGLEETRHVFLQHNSLTERFAALKPGQAFVVAESGFGTGLNFLATWQAFLEEAPADSLLHFVSVERFPLSPDDLSRTHALWPELAELAEELIASYPPLVEGCHRLVLSGGRVRLTLHFGDVRDAWSDLEFTADAWFLDGFAPARNPELWEPQVITQVRHHSHQGTTLASFTAAGSVLRALADVGFRMERVPGYGPKREMIAGVLDLPGPSLPPPPKSRTRTVLIVGAGIAGCLLARNLAGRGYQVHVVDQGPGPGSGASGNPQGALYTKLGVELNDQTRLALASLLFAQRFYPATAPDAWHQTGLLMMAASDREQQRQGKFLNANDYPDAILRPVTPQQARELTGVPCPTGGLWFPASGWLEPPRVCARLLDHPRIQVTFEYRATRLLPCNSRWCLSGEGLQDLVADEVVIAAGHLTRNLMPVTGQFRMKPIRGQVTCLPADTLTASPRAVIAGERYLNPAQNGRLVTGATFDLGDSDPNEREDSHVENIERLNTMLPGLLKTGALVNRVNGRVAFRCSTHDYQPVAGPLVNGQGQMLEGAWLLTGFGSKGLSWGPLMAEYLADRICSQPSALPRSLMRRVNPARCLA